MMVDQSVFAEFNQIQLIKLIKLQFMSVLHVAENWFSYDDVFGSANWSDDIDSGYLQWPVQL
jgi:hypothetical protein